MFGTSFSRPFAREGIPLGVPMKGSLFTRYLKNLGREMEKKIATSTSHEILVSYSNRLIIISEISKGSLFIGFVAKTMRACLSCFGCDKKTFPKSFWNAMPVHMPLRILILRRFRTRQLFMIISQGSPNNQWKPPLKNSRKRLKDGSTTLEELDVY